MSLFTFVGDCTLRPKSSLPENLQHKIVHFFYSNKTINTYKFLGCYRSKDNISLYYFFSDFFSDHLEDVKNILT